MCYFHKQDTALEAGMGQVKWCVPSSMVTFSVCPLLLATNAYDPSVFLKAEYVSPLVVKPDVAILTASGLTTLER